MQQLEPTYLRYVYDGLSKGSISSNNPTSLPIGFIGLFEDEFPSSMPLVERMSILNRLATWALLKGPVSIEMVAEILDEHPDNTKALVNTYSKWFNSPEPGKYVLYHDRLRTYLLQKLSNHEVQDLNETLISYLENALNSEGLKEAELYALEHLSTHMAVESQMGNNYERLHEFVNQEDLWKRQITTSNEYKWSQRAVQYGIKEGARRHHEINTLISTVNSVELSQIEQNDINSIFDLVKNENLEVAFERISNLEAENSSAITLLILHEFIYGESRFSKNNIKNLKSILTFFKNKTEGIVPAWYPKIMVIGYQKYLDKIGLISPKELKAKSSNDKHNFFEEKVYGAFWDLFDDDQTNYIKNKIEIVNFKFRDFENKGYFTYFLSLLDIEPSWSRNYFPNIIDFKKINYSRYQNDNNIDVGEHFLDLIPLEHDITGYDKLFYYYLYCGYRYLILKEEISSFIDKKTNKKIESNSDAAICCFKTAFQIIKNIDQSDFSDHQFYDGIFKIEKSLLLLKTINLFKKNIHIQDLKPEVINYITNYQLFDSSDNMEICSLIFEFYLEKKEYENCLAINNRINFNDVFIQWGGLIYNNHKENNLVRLLNNLKIENINTDLKYNELIETDFARCKILLNEADFYLEKNDYNKAKGLVIQAYNHKNKYLFHYSKIRQDAIAFFIKSKDFINAENLIQNFVKFVDLQSKPEWVAEQYISLKENFLKYDYTSKSEISYKLIVTKINLIDNSVSKNNKIIHTSKVLLKYNKIEDFYAFIDSFTISQKGAEEISCSLINKIDINDILDFVKKIKFDFANSSKFCCELFPNLNDESLMDIYLNYKSQNISEYILSKSNKPEHYAKFIRKMFDNKKPNYQFRDEFFEQSLNDNQISFKINNLKSLLDSILINSHDEFGQTLERYKSYINKLLKRKYVESNNGRLLVNLSKSIDGFSDMILSEKIIVNNIFRHYLKKKITKDYLINFLNNLVKQIDNFIEVGFLCNQKIKLLLYISYHFEQLGLIKNCFDFIDYAKSANVINKKIFNEDYSPKILEMELVFNFRHKSIEELKSIESSMSNLTEGMNNQSLFFSQVKYGIFLIYFSNPKIGLKYLLGQLVSFFEKCPYDPNPTLGEFIVSPDIREHIINEYIIIAKKFANALKDSSSILKIDNIKNEILFGGSTKVDEKINELSIVDEYKRLINLDFSDFSIDRYSCDSVGDISYDSVEYFENELNSTQKIKFKSFDRLIYFDEIKEDQLLNCYHDNEYNLITKIFKIKNDYFYIPDGNESFESLPELIHIDYFKLSKWDESYFFSFLIKHSKNYKALINILFSRLKKELFKDELITNDNEVNFDKVLDLDNYKFINK